MRLVTLQQARDHLRSDTDADDNDLLLKIEAASELIADYLKPAGMASFTDSAGYVLEDSNGDPLGVPRRVKAAALLMVGYLYKDRDANTDNAFSMGFLPAPVTALIYSRRVPTAA